MNNLSIIGNLTRAPETKDVNGVYCCTFTVAVNRRVREGAHPEADYFRVTAWRKLGENCAKYLDKGRKVYVSGSASAYGYVNREGEAKASMQITANEVEFLSPRGSQDADVYGEDVPPEVADGDDQELPF